MHALKLTQTSFISLCINEKMFSFQIFFTLVGLSLIKKFLLFMQFKIFKKTGVTENYVFKRKLFLLI